MGRLHRRVRQGAAASLVLVTACVTVNIYFPAAKVEKAAKEIVNDVYGKKDSGDQSRLMPAEATPSWLSWLGPREALAQEATSVSNAAIRGLKQQIAEQHRKLLPYYRSGQVGIGRDGYLETRDTGGLSLPQVAALKRLVEADNAARRQLYAEVARALNIPSDQVGKVQQIFAQEWRAEAQSGWWIQEDSGQWKRK